MSNFGSTLYDGSASLGKAESYVGLFVGGIVSIILIIIAIHLLFINQSNLVDSNAIVVDSHCVSNYDNKEGVTYNCNLHIKYAVGGKSYSGQISTTGSTSYTVGDNVDITYNSTNPSEVTARQLRDKTLGYILLGVGILIGAGSYFNYYMTSHYKIYAAAQGASTGLDLMDNTFRRF